VVGRAAERDAEVARGGLAGDGVEVLAAAVEVDDGGRRGGGGAVAVAVGGAVGVGVAAGAPGPLLSPRFLLPLLHVVEALDELAPPFSPHGLADEVRALG
jgi:hypothetical protein